MTPRLNLVVLRTNQPEATVAFYELLGLTFHAEQHGSGSLHHAAQAGDVVFEIYPRANDTAPIRLGFAVANLESVLSTVPAACVASSPRDMPWGRSAVILDPVGNKIELVETISTV